MKLINRVILILLFSLTSFAGKDGGNGGGIYYPEDGRPPIMLDLALVNPYFKDRHTGFGIRMSSQEQELGIKVLSSMDTRAGIRLMEKLKAYNNEEANILPEVLMTCLRELRLNFVEREIPTTYESENIDVSGLPSGKVEGFAYYTRAIGAVVNINHWNAAGDLSREAILLKESLRRVQINYGLLNDSVKIYKAVPEILFGQPGKVNLDDLVSGMAARIDQKSELETWLDSVNFVLLDQDEKVLSLSQERLMNNAHTIDLLRDSAQQLNQYIESELN